MENYIKKGLLGAGVTLTCLSLMAGCQTVKGTVHGAGQDLQAVGSVLEGQPAPKPQRHKTYKKQIVSKKNMSNNSAIASARANANNNESTQPTSKQKTVTKSQAQADMSNQSESY